MDRGAGEATVHGFAESDKTSLLNNNNNNKLKKLEKFVCEQLSLKIC